MREIKFRAWNTNRKRMHTAEEMGEDQLTLSPDGRGFINVHGTSTKLSQYLPHLLPMQFTGLCDKNSKEIWEGDIIIHDNHIRSAGHFKIDWDKYKAGWVLLGVGKEKAMWLKDWSADFVEIIGNIHENPELREKAT